VRAGLGPFLERHGRVLLALLVVLVAAFHAGRVFRAEQVLTEGEISLPLDDSFIYLQYSRAIAEGHPFVYTKGNAPTTGATSLAYPLLLVPPHLFRLPPSFAIGWALALGLFGYVLSALLMARIGSRLGGRTGGALALILFLASPFLLWGYMSGMEIALYGTVLLVCFRAYLRERGEESGAARFSTLRWWLFALAVSRPEGAVLAGGFGILMLVDRVKTARRESGTTGARRSALRALGPDALLPFTAAALPFLVNLLVSGSIEATSSQAKSILAEPYRDTKLSYLNGSPSVWLAISRVYLAMMQVEMEGLRIRHTDLAAVNAIGVALFLVFAFVPRHRPWPRGLALVPILAAGVLVNSLPVHWYVHLFRYLQGIYPLVLLLIAAGWGRLASFAWAKAPALVRVPAALLVAAIPLAIWTPRLLPEQARIIKFYAHNCENILHQQVKVGRWIDGNLRPDAIVGLNDAGAIAYYGRRQTVDLIGLTSAGYARVYRSGLGCLFEHIRREPPPRLPTYFAVYPGWFPYWRESGILGPEAFRAHLGFNTICGAADMMVYPASWVDVAATDRPETQLAGKRLVDSIDLAWLEDEKRHEWRAEPEAKDVLRQYIFPDRPTRPLTDGGRIVYGLQRFRVQVTPGRDLTMILRTDAWYPSRIRVLVDGKDAGTWDIARADTSWTEPAFTVPATRIAGARPEITLRREGEGGTQTRSEVPESQTGNLAPFHIWFYQ
jgi:MFS family permease